MQSVFSNALSEMAAKHLSLSRTRQETLCWLVLLMLRFSTISLWRLAAATDAQVDSVRRPFYRFFQSGSMRAVRRAWSSLYSGFVASLGCWRSTAPTGTSARRRSIF
ncbi:hypothetical protein OLZ32_20710 [Rhizobium sp. 1AS11]|uniref:hypothetical protein n=1 Tax=Rhizobium acaciae TaxID=2989736 RepID=UPI002222606A|nr:hypothetical protein [Rhizobium acaciae]MCW1410873.1 hypothetical protein [Rhizobium acaciae]MCW1742828.1 hypothetical protein [Rhizobium acaciae]